MSNTGTKQTLFRVWTATVSVLVGLGVLGVPASAAPRAESSPAGGERGAQWTSTHDRIPEYPGTHIDWDVPITMSDGVVIKANVYRPMDTKGRIVTTPLPTIVNMTPYTKLAYMLLDSAISIPGLYDPITTLINRFDLFNLNGTPLSSIGDQVKAASGGAGRVIAADRKLVQSGYTEVIADVRGTGFSQGIWQAFGQREQQDTAEIAEWAAKQPWSAGKVGLSGMSNGGISALQGAAQRPTSVKAVFATVPGSDLLRDTLAPGGGFDIGFVPFWLAAINTGKWVPDLASVVRGQFDWKWLADRVASPITFIDTLLRVLIVPSVNEVPPDMKVLLNPNGPFRSGLTSHPNRIQAPTFVIGGWHDIFNNSNSTIFNEIPLPTTQKKLLVGDWYHTTVGSGLGVSGAPPRIDVLQRAWFDKWLKGIDNGIDTYGPAILFQQGGRWTATSQFPRAGMTYTRHYLTAHASRTVDVAAFDGTLSPAVPTGRPIRATVSPGLSTLCSRDAAAGTAGILGIVDGCGKDSRVAEVAALTFTGKPVSQPTALSGPVNVHLNTVLDATDGYWSATLNDVAPDGRSTVLTSGQLTASLRHNDPARSTYSSNGDYTAPFPTLTLDDRQPIVPGQSTILDIGLEPTDAVLLPGHRLRVDIYAANFPKGMMIPPLLRESELRPQHLVLDPSAPSFVNLPLDRAL